MQVNNYIYIVCNILHFSFVCLYVQAREKFESSEAIYNKLLEKRNIDPTLVSVGSIIFGIYQNLFNLRKWGAF